MIDFFRTFVRCDVRTSISRYKCSATNSIRITPGERLIHRSHEHGGDRIVIDVIDTRNSARVIVSVPGAKSIRVAGWWEFNGDVPSLKKVAAKCSAKTDVVPVIECGPSPLANDGLFNKLVQSTDNTVLKMLLGAELDRGDMYVELEWLNSTMSLTHYHFQSKQSGVGYTLTTYGYWRMKLRQKTSTLEITTSSGTATVHDESIARTPLISIAYNGIVLRFTHNLKQVYIGVYIVDGKLITSVYKSDKWTYHYTVDRHYLIYVHGDMMTVVDMLSATEMMNVRAGPMTFPLAYDDHHDMLIYEFAKGVGGYRYGEYIKHYKRPTDDTPQLLVLSFQWVQEQNVLYILYQDLEFPFIKIVYK